MKPLIVLLLAVLFACPAFARSSYTIDIGGPLDEFFVEAGWYGVEGPYPQFGGIWDSRARWATRGAVLRVPVFPGVVNSIEVRCQVADLPGQKLRFFIDGRLAASFTPRSDLLYIFDVEPQMLGDTGWAQLGIEVDTPSPGSAGDPRDLRAVVDRILVSADAEVRPYMADLLKELGLQSPTRSVDAAPGMWRMRYDANNVGDRSAVQSFSEVNADDSAFDLVPTSHVPPMRRGDAAWYRAWAFVERVDPSTLKLSLPGKGFESDGLRQAWVNGEQVADGPEPLEARTALQLKAGANLVVVKLMKGPLPRVTGDSVIERPQFEGRWSPGLVMFRPGTLVLAQPWDSVQTLTIGLVSPSGRRVGHDLVQVRDLEDGRRGASSRAMWEMDEYGQYEFVVEDGVRQPQRFPVHMLGIHLFHWGWYSAEGGTTWNGFRPCSNDYLDQLFSRLGDWEAPHHSICWGGAVLAPGTGFHRTTNADYVGKFREAIAAGQVDFVGMPYPPRNICTDYGETLIRSMRRSLAVYESQLGVRPNRFYSHDATLTPLLPQIMRLCGYDTYCIAENWWGQGRSIPNSRDCYWQSADGATVRVLDSWYHGIEPSVAARRAVEQGKPAVLCNEEFACLDSTVFLNEAEVDSLAAEGIFLKPISLDEYSLVTQEFAAAYTYSGEDELCYKGWTGGAEGEVEFEKANRILQPRLVALENVAAFAGWLGIEMDTAELDSKWDRSLRMSECHLHWGNGIPEVTAELRAAADWADEQMAAIAGRIAARVDGVPGGALIVNPLGFRRGGMVTIQAPDGARSIRVGTRSYPLQPHPDRRGGRSPQCTTCRLWVTRAASSRRRRRRRLSGQKSGAMGWCCRAVVRRFACRRTAGWRCSRAPAAGLQTHIECIWPGRGTGFQPGA